MFKPRVSTQSDYEFVSIDELVPDYHLPFLPGSACYPVEQENHHLRVSYSYMNEQLLQQGVTTLCNILHSQITSKTVHESSPYF
ncbi:hypothetical protein ACSU6B_26955 [Neobacillus sp. C211]|uniref:hypothetical protein n=1 Tax=unclassified Neobacillus TaxID=2675272 RepID=UPI0039785CF4